MFSIINVLENINMFDVIQLQVLYLMATLRLHSCCLILSMRILSFI